MRYHQRLYQLHIILGHKNEPALWELQGWQAIQANLLRVTKAARGPASLNSLQHTPISDNEYVDAKFGRLGLSEKSDSKWVHDYISFPERKKWIFHSVELWAPGRTTCGNQNMAPDVYLGIADESYYRAFASIKFNPYIVLAGAVDKGEEFLSDVNSLATGISQQTKSVLHIHKTLSWGRSSGSGFNAAIGDLLASSVFKGALSHSDIPLIDQIEAYWK